MNGVQPEQYAALVEMWGVRTREIANEMWHAANGICGLVQDYTQRRLQISDEERSAQRKLSQAESNLRYGLYGPPVLPEKLIVLCNDVAGALTMELIRIVVIDEDKAAPLLTSPEPMYHRWNLFAFASYCVQASDCMCRIQVLWNFSPFIRLRALETAVTLAELPGFPGSVDE